MLLIHGLWFCPNIWTPWLPELDQAGYDAVVLAWNEDRQPPGSRPTAAAPDFGTLLRAARTHTAAFPARPIVIGHGAGAAVAERLLADGDAAAAISLAPTPGGYSAISGAARLLGRRTGLALLTIRASPVMPTFPQFRSTIANASSDADARRLYDMHVTMAAPRNVLLRAARNRPAARRRLPARGPLLLAAGGKDELIRELSTALLHRNYRRRQPESTTDYMVFPGLDHTLSLGTEDTIVLFYCLDWLLTQNM